MPDLDGQLSTIDEFRDHLRQLLARTRRLDREEVYARLMIEALTVIPMVEEMK